MVVLPWQFILRLVQKPIFFGLNYLRKLLYSGLEGLKLSHPLTRLIKAFALKKAKEWILFPF